MEALRGDLKRYPSTFSVTDSIKAVSNENKIKIKNKLLVELCSLLNEFSTSMEKVRVWNLLSFLYFCLGDRKTANRYNSDVLKESPNNIIALANNAWFTFQDKKNMKVCKDILERLKTLKSDKMANIIAKAELAFTYSRFGIKQYHYALAIFSEVVEEIKHGLLKEIRKIDHDLLDAEKVKEIDTLTEFRCVWTYGYALTLQRLLHSSNISEKDDMEALKKRHISVFENYGEIMRLENRSECILRYKARTLVEAGLLAYGVERNKVLFPYGMKGLLPRNSEIFMPTYKYFKTALEVFPNDVFVLERCGRYFRYVDEIMLSISLLQKAVDVKGTSFGHHHLALSYIRMLEYSPKRLEHVLASSTSEHIIPTNQCHTSLKTSTESTVCKKLETGISDQCLVAGVLSELDDLDIHSVKSPSFKILPTENTNSVVCGLKSERNNQPSSFRCDKGNALQTKFTKNINITTKCDSQLNPMADVFVPKEQQKHEVKFPSQSSGTIYQRYGRENVSDFNTRSLDIRNTPQFDSNNETFHVLNATRKRHTHQERSRRMGQPLFDYTHGIEYHRTDSRLRSSDGKRINSCRQEKNTKDKNFKQRTFQPIKHDYKDSKLQYGVKCHRFPKYIDYEKNKELVDITISHLDKSTEISPNTMALYDKAVLYRQINRNEEALDVLEILMQNNDDLFPSTCITLANTYEQAAFCISDILDSKDKIDKAKAEQLMNDRQFYLKSSIEIACNIVAKHPYLDNCWGSAQTLRNILLIKSKTKQTKDTLKDLWFLYSKLNSHSEVIGVLKELKDLAEDEAEKKEIIEEIVRRYICLKHYEEAVIALCMLKPLNDVSTCVDRSLYVQVYIEAGVDAFRKKHFDKARLRIKKAFEPKKEDVSGNGSTLTKDQDESYDLYVLSNLDEEEQGRNLSMLLNNLGLHATFNTDSMSILPGAPEVEGMTQVMNVSKQFVILVNFDVDDKKMQHIVDRMQAVVEERIEESRIMVICNPGTEIPAKSRMSSYKRLNLVLTCISETCMENDDMCESITSLLIELASI